MGLDNISGEEGMKYCFSKNNGGNWELSICNQ
jgi:hypothetical protein